VICQLCKKAKPLVKSHIYPKSFYKLIKKSEKPNPRSFSDRPGSRPRRSPSGDFDKIVCNDCEAIFGPWDDYAFEFLSKIPPITHIVGPIKIPKGKKKINHLIFDEFDYPKLKLFFLSLLWRSHASKRKDYESVYLGPYEKSIREMILSNDPGRAEDFPVFIDKYKMDPNLHVISSPQKGRLFDKILAYMIQLVNLEISIIVSNQILKEPIPSKILRPDKPLRILLVNLDGSPLEKKIKKIASNKNNLKLKEWLE